MPAASYSRRRSPHAIIQSRRGIRQGRGLAVNAAVGGGGGAPSIPADVLVGQPAWSMNAWGGVVQLEYTAATFATWQGRGFGGFGSDIGYLRHFGGSWNFRGSTGAGGDATYTHQRRVEGIEAAPFNQPFVANVHAASSIATMSVYMQSADSGNVPPFGDWWNATLESNFAADMADIGAFHGFIGMNGLVLDFEPYNGKTWGLGYSGNTHTEAQNRAKVYEWFYNAFAAYLVGHPHPLIFIYSMYLPASYNNELQEAEGRFGVFEARMDHDALHGMAAAMAAANSNGRIILADASYYRPALAQSNKLNTQGQLAYLSQYMNTPAWKWFSRHGDVDQFTWMGTDNTPYYNGTQPAEPAGSNMFAQARTWGMGPYRLEYAYDGGVEQNAAFGLYAGANNWTTPAGRVTGMQTAASQSAISTAAPPLTITSAIASGGSVTLTGTAGPNAYGTRAIEVYDSNLVWLGSAVMTWNKTGGTTATNYDNAYMTWAFTTTGVAGNWYVVTHVSAKDDRHSDRKQAT